MIFPLKYLTRLFIQCNNFIIYVCMRRSNCQVWHRGKKRSQSWDRRGNWVSKNISSDHSLYLICENWNGNLLSVELFKDISVDITLIRDDLSNCCNHAFIFSLGPSQWQTTLLWCSSSNNLNIQNFQKV